MPEDAHDARRYFAEGKKQSIVLLGQAISTLKDEIADQEQEDAVVSAIAAPELDLSRVFRKPTAQFRDAFN